MILGKNGFFVTPSDSVAVLAANASCIPYLSRGEGLRPGMCTLFRGNRKAADNGQNTASG